MAQSDPLSGLTDDPALAKVLRQGLEQMATGAAGPELRDLATDVLSGRGDIRKLMMSSAYEEVVSARSADFMQWYGGLSEAEREEHAARGEAYLDEVRAEDVRRPARPAPRPEPIDDEDWPPTTYLR
ncbi:hypothetical protein NLX83_06490 [Allokutzneria sp. A3M-2-11 16]|uniref:hypothetical protein n=1 Tax=Allokutzneria sp. A3M-2-11 16 TaxID=2962043 RepID=UPI0020B824E5|nr:hypothetical protein [Allokutzneria sp. A3M-2-11 16]MCP3798902.1 hypothetical protein [Allokutzneria sp. A3M-2-11 16]